MYKKHILLIPQVKKIKDPLNNTINYIKHDVRCRFYNSKIYVIENDYNSYKQVKCCYLNKKQNKNILNLISKNCIIDELYHVTNILEYNTYILLYLKEV